VAEDGATYLENARAILAGLAEYKRAWDQRARAAAETPTVTRTR